MSTESVSKNEIMPMPTENGTPLTRAKEEISTDVLEILQGVVGLSEPLAQRALPRGVHLNGLVYTHNVPVRLCEGDQVIAGKTRINVILAHIKNLDRRQNWPATESDKG